MRLAIWLIAIGTLSSGGGIGGLQGQTQIFLIVCAVLSFICCAIKDAEDLFG